MIYSYACMQLAAVCNRASEKPSRPPSCARAFGALSRAPMSGYSGDEFEKDGDYSDDEFESESPRKPQGQKLSAEATPQRRLTRPP